MPISIIIKRSIFRIIARYSSTHSSTIRIHSTAVHTHFSTSHKHRTSIRHWNLCHFFRRHSLWRHSSLTLLHSHLFSHCWIHLSLLLSHHLLFYHCLFFRRTRLRSTLHLLHFFWRRLLLLCRLLLHSCIHNFS